MSIDVWNNFSMLSGSSRKSIRFTTISPAASASFGRASPIPSTSEIIISRPECRISDSVAGSVSFSASSRTAPTPALSSVGMFSIIDAARLKMICAPVSITRGIISPSLSANSSMPFLISSRPLSISPLEKTSVSPSMTDVTAGRNSATMLFFMPSSAVVMSCKAS